jgi:hypothetical protein
VSICCPVAGQVVMTTPIGNLFVFSKDRNLRERSAIPY